MGLYQALSLIEDLPFSRRVSVNEIRIVYVFMKLFFIDDHKVNRSTNICNLEIQLLSQFSSMGSIFLDYQEVIVAILSIRLPNSRSKKYNLFRVRYLLDG